MLVMSRRQGETILIGDQIEIVISHIGRSRVKVGIRAPREMTVIARELKLVCEENRAAAGASPARLSGLIARLQPSSTETRHPEGATAALVEGVGPSAGSGSEAPLAPPEPGPGAQVTGCRP